MLSGFLFIIIAGICSTIIITTVQENLLSKMVHSPSDELSEYHKQLMKTKKHSLTNAK